MFPRGIAALEVVFAEDEEEEEEDGVDSVSMVSVEEEESERDVDEGLEEELLVWVAVAFLEPHLFAFLQASWPMASLGCASMHWP